MRADKEQVTEILQHFPLFEGFEEAQVRELANYAQYQRLGKHSTIFREGSRADRIYFLIKGVVKIGTHSSDGREVIKHVLHPLKPVRRTQPCRRTGAAGFCSRHEPGR